MHWPSVGLTLLCLLLLVFAVLAVLAPDPLKAEPPPAAGAKPEPAKADPAAKPEPPKPAEEQPLTVLDLASPQGSLLVEAYAAVRRVEMYGPGFNVRLQCEGLSQPVELTVGERGVGQRWAGSVSWSPEVVLEQAGKRVLSVTLDKSQ